MRREENRRGLLRQQRAMLTPLRGGCGANFHVKGLLGRLTNPRTLSSAQRARRKFLRYFPKGFYDETYLEWEREYKCETHLRWEEALNRDEFLSPSEKARLCRDRRAGRADGATFASQHDFLVRKNGVARRGKIDNGRASVRHRALRIPLWSRRPQNEI